MWENDDEGAKWIKIDTNIIFTINPEQMAREFFGIFVEPFYKRESVCLDLRKFTKHEAYKFVETIKKLSDKSTNVVFVFNKEVKRK